MMLRCRTCGTQHWIAPIDRLNPPAMCWACLYHAQRGHRVECIEDLPGQDVIHRGLIYTVDFVQYTKIGTFCRLFGVPGDWLVRSFYWIDAGRASVKS
jgi:hypothetical protein